MKKQRFKLWHQFAIIMTVVVLVYLSFLSFVVMLIIHRSGAVNYRLLPLTILLVASISIAGITTTLVAHIFLRPIDKISDAMIRVAAGDFTPQLDETERIGNIELMNINFNKMVRELNSIEMLKSDFITNVSHEFKTPLASIEGYATLLTATDLNAEQRLYTDNILESVSNLGTLTGNILRLSKLENQQFHEEKKTFSLDEQIRQSILMLEPQWSGKNLSIEPDLESVDFRGYEELLPQVWTNLISNSVKFTPAGGTIVFRLHAADGGVVFSITDNGIGMNEEEQAHAFDKFYQAENNHSVAGNGLGLPLVKQIVDMHGGTVQIKSAPDEGSTFTIFLPN
jgi:signal transduction histidine kinase